MKFIMTVISSPAHLCDPFTVTRKYMYLPGEYTPYKILLDFKHDSFDQKDVFLKKLQRLILLVVEDL